MQKRAFCLIALFLVLLNVVACGIQAQSATPTPPPPTSTPIPPLTLEALKNAEYDSEFPKDHKAKLTDGKYQEEYQPGAATKLIIGLHPAYAIGDLNGDGVDDAAVILVANPGGSGTFYHLAAVVNENGTPEHVASQSLGDRIQVKSISIRSGEIVLDMVVHGPSDPLCCPTVEVTRTYKLQGDKLSPIPGS